MTEQDAAPAVGPAELQRLCAFLHRRTGLFYGEAKRPYVERRLLDCMARAGAASFAAYMALLRTDAAEAARLVSSFTVNETYFFREEYQLRCLSQALLPAVVARRGPGDRVRIWSIPCSTGEEPYSIAIWLLENWAMVDAFHVEIVGSDIDARALAGAVAGEYGARALHRLPAAVAARYFEPLPDGQHRIIRDIRESVTLAEANLVDAASMAAQGRFDVVFCRNVLIYFDDASCRAAADALWDALLPGGFLCLGHSESMARISPRFAARRFADATVWQRPNERLGAGRAP